MKKRFLLSFYLLCFTMFISNFTAIPILKKSFPLGTVFSFLLIFILINLSALITDFCFKIFNSDLSALIKKLLKKLKFTLHKIEYFIIFRSPKSRYQKYFLLKSIQSNSISIQELKYILKISPKNTTPHIKKILKNRIIKEFKKLYMHTKIVDYKLKEVTVFSYEKSELKKFTEKKRIPIRKHQSKLSKQHISSLLQDLNNELKEEVLLYWHNIKNNITIIL